MSKSKSNRQSEHFERVDELQEASSEVRTSTLSLNKICSETSTQLKKEVEIRIEDVN